jgi:hypothetical protein
MREDRVIWPVHTIAQALGDLTSRLAGATVLPLLTEHYAYRSGGAAGSRPIGTSKGAVTTAPTLSSYSDDPA